MDCMDCIYNFLIALIVFRVKNNKNKYQVTDVGRRMKMRMGLNARARGNVGYKDAPVTFI